MLTLVSWKATGPDIRKLASSLGELEPEKAVDESKVEALRAEFASSEARAGVVEDASPSTASLMPSRAQVRAEKDASVLVCDVMCRACGRGRLPAGLLVVLCTSPVASRLVFFEVFFTRSLELCLPLQGVERTGWESGFSRCIACLVQAFLYQGSDKQMSDRLGQGQK